MCRLHVRGLLTNKNNQIIERNLMEFLCLVEFDKCEAYISFKRHHFVVILLSWVKNPGMETVISVILKS